jgi:hypothetical protein
MTDVDPLSPRNFLKLFWPHVSMYKEQWAVIDSVEENPETFVSAGNMLGKDFLSGYIIVRAIIVNPVARIVTTSVKDEHLDVLWGEIGRFIETCKYPLKSSAGGPLIVNHHHIRKQNVKTGEQDKISYVKGMVSKEPEGLAGHHAPYTLGVIDEASGVSNIAYTQIGTWAKHILAIGNPNPCGRDHFFYRGVKGGDLLDEG